MDKLPVPNVKAGYLAVAAFLVGGGAEQLQARLSRQVLGWLGAAFAIASVIGFWGVIDTFVLTQDQFYVGISAAVLLLGSNHFDNRLALRPDSLAKSGDVIEAGK